MQKQTNFKLGNIVQLNSGSPNMKIVSIQDEKAIVEWLNDDGGQERETIPLVCLHGQVSESDRARPDKQGRS